MICHKCQNKDLRDMKDGFFWCPPCDLMLHCVKQATSDEKEYAYYYLYECQHCEKDSYHLIDTVMTKKSAEEWVGTNPYRFWRDANKEKFKK